MKTTSVCLLVLSTYMLSACQVSPNLGNVGLGFGLGGGSGSGVHFGTGINIPISVMGIPNNPAKTGINLSQEQVVSYFAPASGHYQPSDKPVANGFYRKLLGKQGQSQWLVQDFYYTSGRKYSEPMLLSEHQAYQFDAAPINGTLYTYHENGQLASKRVYQNQRLMASETWSADGRAIR